MKQGYCKVRRLFTLYLSIYKIFAIAQEIVLHYIQNDKRSTCNLSNTPN
ncbi:MAG: hypothetical protein JWQ79_3766 [Mucilaginibacter sp.]|nr:hypothetical protein [Mucilaginibacter sp.]